MSDVPDLYIDDDGRIQVSCDGDCKAYSLPGGGIRIVPDWGCPQHGVEDPPTN